jgi:cytochrome P450
MPSEVVPKTLTSDDSRYEEMFKVYSEPAESGIDINHDYSPDMSALRNRAPVLKGSIYELLGLPEPGAGMAPKREAYTFLSYRACAFGFQEGLIFSSKILNETPGLQAIGPTMFTMAGDEHKRHRAVAQPLFARPRAAGWWNNRWIHRMVALLLDRLLDWETADLNLELCARLPMHVVTMAMGLEDVDALNFRYHLARSTFGAKLISPEEVEQSREVVDRMLRDLIEARLKTPGDDVITGMLKNDLKLPDGSTRKLKESELLSFCKLLLFAGGNTSWRQTGITIHTLLTHYDAWEACRDNRSLIEQAVDESMRWRGVHPYFPRLCTKDTEVEGVMVPAGAVVYLCMDAANHDPEVFERPDEYDIFRPKAHHMSFGFGPHRCLGTDVAKQEMVVAINGLMDRWPNLQIDPDKPKPIFCGFGDRGVPVLTVRLK